jgi:hypothetical protein
MAKRHTSTLQKADLERQMCLSAVEDVRRALIKMSLYGGQRGFELVQTIYQRVPELNQEREGSGKHDSAGNEPLLA